MPYTRPMAGLFQRALHEQREELCGVLERLVRTPLESSPGREFESVVTALCDMLRRFGLSPNLLSLPAPDGMLPPTIVATVGSGGDMAYLHGRYRALPAGHPRQFDPWWSGDQYFGRGVAETTGGVVALIYAMKMLASHQLPLRGRVRLVLVPWRDSTTVERAMAQLVEVGIIGRGGLAMYTPAATAGRIYNASRGVIRWRVTVRAPRTRGDDVDPTVHAADRASETRLLAERRFAAPDAMTLAQPILQELSDLRHRVTKRRTEFAPLLGPANQSVLVVGGNVDGEARFWAQPEVCSFEIDRRLNPEESLDEERSALLQIVERARQAGTMCEVETLEEGSPSGVPSRAESLRSLERAVYRVRKTMATVELYPWLLDTHFYAQAGIPALAYGPGDPRAIEGMREFIRASDVLECAAIFAMAVLHEVADPHADLSSYA